METRLANIAIIVEKEESVERLNQILHKYGSYIIGRMGIPHKERGVNIISIAIDAPQNEISSLSAVFHPPSAMLTVSRNGSADARNKTAVLWILPTEMFLRSKLLIHY